MGRAAVLVVVATVAGAIATVAAAQATGMPSFNAPYPAFKRSELGAVFSFPDGGGTGFEGVYRVPSGGNLDVGFRAGLFDPKGSGSSSFLAGAEGRSRVIKHTEDFPLDGAIIFGAGASLVSDASTLFIPVGLSLGRRVEPQGSTIKIVPYVQPTFSFVAGEGRSSGVEFGFGLGADFLLSRVFEARISGGLGDHPLTGVSIGAVWVH